MFTSDLLSEFDRNRNSRASVSRLGVLKVNLYMNGRWLEFDEFRKLYMTHLFDDAALNELRTRVKIRFRSEEEIKALAEERAMIQRRAKLKLELEMRREANRAIRERQKRKNADSYYRDCDGNLRRGRDKPALKTVSTQMEPTEYETTVSTNMAITRRMRRRLIREKQVRKRKAVCATEHKVDVFRAMEDTRVVSQRRQQVVRLLQEAGYTNVRASSLDDRIGTIVCHDVPHPSFSGRAYGRLILRSQVTNHPIFHGLVRVPLIANHPLHAFELLAFARDIRRPSAAAWHAFCMPPLCRGIARQRYREAARAHDRSEIVHPAVWGSFVASTATFYDANYTSPTLYGYTMQRQVLDAGSRPQRTDGLCPLRRIPRGGGCVDPIVGIRSGFDELAEPCHVCLGGQCGCPFCFELPEGLKLHEYSYMPGDTTHEHVSKVFLTLHTDLTTRTALAHDRHVRHNRAEVLIKSVPCGAVTKLTLLCDDSVAHLHHLFRATSVHGVADIALFHIPTEHGLVELDIEASNEAGINDGMELPNRGTIPLFKYGLNQAGARAVLFHGCHTSMWSMIHVFISNNLLLERLESALDFVPHLDGAPRTLPGSDLVQHGLWDVFVLQVSQQKLYAQQDEAAEQQFCRDLEKREMEHHHAIMLAARQARCSS